MIRDLLEDHFKVVGEVIRTAALASAALGTIMLAATTGVNVIERTREIGVIRTLGATQRRVGAIFPADGAAITTLRAIFSIAISLALSQTILYVAERRLLYVTVQMTFSIVGLFILCSGALVFILLVQLTVAYSLRRSVCDALTYE